MPTTRYFLLFVLLLAALAVFACDTGDDDDNDDVDLPEADDDTALADDDDDNDDNDDDNDDDDDNDTSPEEVVVTGVNNSACLDGSMPDKDDPPEPWDPWTDPSDVILLTWQDGVLHVVDQFAFLNCCMELEVAVEAGGGVVTITENDVGAPCFCNCPFNLAYNIEGLEPGDTTIVIDRVEDYKTTKRLLELTLPLGAADVAWYVPQVDVFAGVEPTPDPFQVSYAACGLYHLEDQQFVVQRYDLNPIVRVFAYDWYDLDDPGTPNPACQVPVTVDIGEFDSGTFAFGAPSFDGTDWSMPRFEHTF